MKGYAMLKIGESGWIEKETPKCGPLDAICKPLAQFVHLTFTLCGRAQLATVTT